MNGNMDTMSRRRTGGVSAMNMGNIIGDPFALATVSIAMVGFILYSWYIFENRLDANMVSFSWHG